MNKVNVWCTMALVMIAFGFSACSDSEDENVAVDPGIIGEWKVSTAQFLYNEQDPAVFVEELAESLDTTVEELEEAGMKTNIENKEQDEVGATFKFNADKTQQITFPGGDEEDDETYQGTWSADENTLTVYYGDDNEGSEYEVRSITKSRATLAYIRNLSKKDVMDFYSIETDKTIFITTLLYLER